MLTQVLCLVAISFGSKSMRQCLRSNSDSLYSPNIHKRRSVVSDALVDCLRVRVGPPFKSHEHEK